MSPYIIPGILRNRPVKFNEIVTVVSRYTGVSVAKMKKKGRQRTTVFARQTIIYLVRKRTTVTLNAAAAFFNQDHTTAIHSIDQIKGLLDIADPKTVKAIMDIEELLR